MKKISLSFFCAYLSITFFIILVLFFTYKALINPSIELDSKFIAIPIAHKILDGSIFNPHTFTSNWFYYPSSAEAILSLFIIFFIPYGLYNVVGYVLLFFALILLARHYKFSIFNSIIYSTSLLLLPAFIRWLPSQKNDIYLALFFTIAFLCIVQIKKSWKYYVTLGLSLGMLIGTKYFGIIYSLALCISFKNRILKLIKNPKIIIPALLIFITGFIWYIRNFIYTSNPIYPLTLLGFKGSEVNPFIHTDLLYLITQNTTSFIQFFNAIFADYLFIPVICGVALLFYMRSKKIFTPNFVSEMNILIVLSFINVALFLFYPSSAKNFSSSMRFLYPFFIPAYLFAYTIFLSQKKEHILYFVSLVSSCVIFSFINYHPKLIIIGFLIMYFVNTLIQKLYKVKLA